MFDRLPRECIRTLQSRVDFAREQLGSLHLDFPETVEEIEELAMLVEVPWPVITSGQYTLADICKWASIWAKRQRVKATLTADVRPPTRQDSPEMARNRYFYEERYRGTPDKAILAAARREHPEWECGLTIQGMRKLAESYGGRHGLPPIPRRKSVVALIELD